MSYERWGVYVDLQDDVTAALSHVSALRDMHGGEICLVTVLPDVSPYVQGEDNARMTAFKEEMVTHAQAGLKAVARSAGNVRVTTEIVFGSIDRALARVVRQRRLDVLAFNNHPEHAVEHLLGGISLTVLNAIGCDGLAVCHAALPRKAMAAVTLDGHAQRVLGVARDLLAHAPLEVVHVLRAQDADYAAEFAHWFGGSTVSHRERVIEVLEPLVQAHGPATLHLERGLASRRLAAFVEREEVDLIVMCAGQHSSIGWRMGSTAYNLLARTRANVLLVRP